MTILLQASLSFMMLFNPIFVKPVSSRMTVFSVVEGLPVFLFESGDHINSCEAGLLEEIRYFYLPDLMFHRKLLRRGSKELSVCLET